MGTRFAAVASSGPLAVAVLVAAAAGLVSFLSPCVLPLVPGYLSYVTGLSGADLAEDQAHGDVLVRTAVRRTRVLVGSSLFVLGFSFVFVCEGLLFGQLGSLLLDHRKVIEQFLGVVTI